MYDMQIYNFHTGVSTNCTSDTTDELTVKQEGTDIVFIVNCVQCFCFYYTMDLLWLLYKSDP